MNTPTLSSSLIWTVIVGMAVVNFGLRFVPMATLSRFKLPDPVMRWLSYVPVAVMGSLFAKEVLLPAFNQASTTPVWLNPGIYGAAISMIIFKFTKSFIGSTLAGIAGFLILRALLGLL